GDCTGLPDGTRCVADRLPCTIDTCQGGTCVAGPPSCPEASGGGAEGTCTSFGCVPSGLPSLCQDDGNPCTADRCDGARGGVHDPPPGPACPDDGDACTTAVCSAAPCTHPDRICDDGAPCPTNQCLPSQGCIFPDTCGGTLDSFACHKVT